MPRAPKTTKLNVNLHVGQRLRERRVSLGLSQDAVGKAIGIASQQVQKYEKGVNAMSAKRLYEFARFLKIQVAFFFEGIDTAVIVHAAHDENTASDRESLEILKSFKSIKDYALRKRVSDLLRTLSLKDL